MTGTAVGASNCSHITSTLTTEDGDFVKKYKSVVSWYSHRSNQTHCQPSKRRKASEMFSTLYFMLSSWEQIAAPTCGTCDIALSRPFVCSQCSYAGCWSDGHVVTHLKESAHLFCKSLSIFSSAKRVIYLGEQASMSKVDLFTVLSATISSIIRNSMQYTLPRL